MKNFLRNKFKVIFLIIFICIISYSITYVYMDKTQKPKTLNPKTEEDADNSFNIKIQNINQLVTEIITSSDYSVKEDNFNKIGEGLKSILKSDDGTLLTQEAFKNQNIYLHISEYPLKNNDVIRMVRYKVNDDYSVEKYFLQYVGENYYFTDINYIGYNTNQLQVFETENTCFAFLISTDMNAKTFSLNEKSSAFYGTVFIPDNNKFLTENIQIPLKLVGANTLKLIQDSDKIKTVVLHSENEPTYVFNTTTHTFDLEDQPFESKVINYEFPQLLLGLSDSYGNIRTLFIYNKDGKLYADEYKEQIIFQRQNKLFALKHFVFYDEKTNTYKGTDGKEYDSATSRVDIKKLLCVPLGSGIDFKIGELGEYIFYGANDIPLHVGEQYISYIQEEYFSEGGSYSENITEIKFDKLDNLSDYNLDGYGLEPNFEPITLADYIYNSRAKEFYQADFSTYAGKTNAYIDFKQLAIKRNVGKWSIMLPVMNEYNHPGNGTYSTWVTEFVNFSNDVPAELYSNIKPTEVPLGWDYWYAKDIIKFPETDVLLAQYDDYIGISKYNKEHAFDKPNQIKIPINLDEYIVSISFGNKESDNDWIDQLYKIK